MKPWPSTPQATDSPEELADWMEIQAILSPDRQYSLEALAHVLNRGGTTDATLPEGDEEEDEEEGGPLAPARPLEVSRRIAEDAFGEIEARERACRGFRDAYPFEVRTSLIRLRGEPSKTDYEFLLLLGYAGPTSGLAGTAHLFERLCGWAAHGHLGGKENQAASIRIGAPRKPPLHIFAQAVDHLCKQLGEGVGVKNASRAQHMGDGKLDIVAYREFPDKRAGKLVIFGQCAAGQSGFAPKLSELDCGAFMRKWLRQPLLVAPIRVFFLPWRPNEIDWEFTVTDAGLLFDRCRIVASIQGVEPVDQAQIEDECQRMLQQLRKPQPVRKPKRRRNMVAKEVVA